MIKTIIILKINQFAIKIYLKHIFYIFINVFQLTMGVSFSDSLKLQTHLHIICTNPSRV